MKSLLTKGVEREERGRSRWHEKGQEWEDKGETWTQKEHLESRQQTRRKWGVAKAKGSECFEKETDAAKRWSEKRRVRAIHTTSGTLETKMTLLICHEGGHLLGAVSPHLHGPTSKRLENKIITKLSFCFMFIWNLYQKAQGKYTDCHVHSVFTNCFSTRIAGCKS